MMQATMLSPVLNQHMELLATETAAALGDMNLPLAFLSCAALPLKPQGPADWFCAAGAWSVCGAQQGGTAQQQSPGP